LLTIGWENVNNMDPNLLKQAMEDVKIVRQTLLNNAQQAFSGGYVLTSSYVGTYSYGVTGSYYNSHCLNGMTDLNGVIKYTYNNDREEEQILDHIEKEGMIILDESDDDSKEKPYWYEVIKPEKLKENVDNIKSLDIDPPTYEDSIEKMAEDISYQIDKQILDSLEDMAWTDKLKKKYQKFKWWMKGKPCPEIEEPTFEQWKEAGE
jgi:hypothetical protein